MVKIIAQVAAHAAALWTGWIFATLLRDMWHHGEVYDLKQVRAPYDRRPEEPIAARKLRYPAAGYVLFAGQCGLFASLLTGWGRRHAGHTVIGSFACVVPMITAGNLLIPELQRSDLRRLRERLRRMKSGTVSEITDAPSLRSSVA